MSEILKNVQLQPDQQDRLFDYDAETGFVRDQDGAFLLFRAETPGKSPSLRTQGDIENDKIETYGKGLYTGNTPESVAPYVWTRPSNVINAYVTPNLSDEHVYNYAHLSRIEAAKSHFELLKKRKALGWLAVSEAFDIQRGDALLATFDAGFDIAAGQSLLSKTKHIVPPRWGIWRGESADLLHVGVASANSKPYGWVVRMAQYSREK